MGLDGVLRAKGDRFIGILNGLDTTVWDPATDADIAAPYSRARPTRQGRLPGRPARARRLRPRRPRGRHRHDRPARSAEGLRPAGRRPRRRCSSAAPGSSSRAAAIPALAGPFRALATRTRDRVALIERFDRAMARRIYAGADLFLMPSRFEPCGQGQMIALRYGTPPIVHRTGGLADTVIDDDDAPGRRHRVRVRRSDRRPGCSRPASRAMAMRDDRRARLGGPPRPRDGGRLRLGDGLGAAYVEAYRRAVGSEPGLALGSGRAATPMWSPRAQRPSPREEIGERSAVFAVRMAEGP